MKSFYFALSCVLLFACNSNKKEAEKNIIPVIKDSFAVAPKDTSQKDSSILSLTKEILTAIKKKDYKTFTTFIHPTAGIRFSAYAFVDSTSDMFFTAASFEDAAVKNPIKKFSWGSYDGSGENIRASVAEYFAKFVYDVDFLNAEKTSLNKMLGHGNSLNNLESVYADLPYTESYFSGFEEKYGGMDWRALRIVYKKIDGKYWVIAIVHDQWTV